LATYKKQEAWEARIQDTEYAPSLLL
jgi:hypothetical protein